MTELEKCEYVGKELTGTYWNYPFCCPYHMEESRNFVRKSFESMTKKILNEK